jgi:hypothetical protein
VSEVCLKVIWCVESDTYGKKEPCFATKEEAETHGEKLRFAWDERWKDLSDAEKFFHRPECGVHPELVMVVECKMFRVSHTFVGNVADLVDGAK